MGLIYLDNAATSWPKPRCTVQAMARALEESGANPGRAGHRLSLEAGRIVERCRQALADMLGETDASRVAFAQNATDALNMAIHGAVRTGDHVVSTLIEHNSVLRPLSELARSGVITLTLVPPDADGRMDAREIERRIREGDDKAALVYEAMAHNLAKNIGKLAVAARGRLDAVLLTGGVAHSAMLTGWVAARTAFLAPVHVLPGENEMESLALGALRVLRGEEEAHVFTEHSEASCAAAC